MSIIGPWGFGVNRTEIEQLVRELVILGTGLPPASVYVEDAAARGPEPPRPWVSVMLGDSIQSWPARAEERPYLAKERWTITVTDSADDTYTIQVLSTDYDFAASSNTITEVRDGLLAAIGSPTGWTAIAVGVDRIQIDSTIDGQRLQVSTSPVSMTLAKDQGDVVIREIRPQQIQCTIECQGLLSIESPLSSQSGSSIADQVEAVLSSRHLTQKMRDCGHVPYSVSRARDVAPLQRQQQSSSMVILAIGTTSRLDVSLESVTQAPVSVAVLQ